MPNRGSHNRRRPSKSRSRNRQGQSQGLQGGDDDTPGPTPEPGAARPTLVTPSPYPSPPNPLRNPPVGHAPAAKTIKTEVNDVPPIASASIRSSKGHGVPSTPSTQTQAEARPPISASLAITSWLREGTARGTRSTKPELVSAFEWEAVDIKKQRSSGIERNYNCGEKKEASTQAIGLDEMSRNRPRGPPTSRDNGLAANEETDMWNKIIQDLRKAKEKNDKQKVLGDQIAALNEKLAREGNKPTLNEHNQLDSLYRQLLKLSEEERAILQDEPSDVIKNLGLLTALRSASEAEAPLNRVALPKSRKKRNETDSSAIESPGPSAAPVSDKLNRVKGSTQRSTSVSSTQARDGRDGVVVKIEEGAEPTKGTLAERSGQLVIGAEVVFKHNKNKQGVEGEGIQCIIKGISGEGLKKRYDVQDPEPNENGEQGAVYKTTAASLIPIPQVGSPLPSFTVGKQVLARYPDTTTFYRAEVMGSKKDAYRLKFEGEEDDKEMEVDKRFVLDIPVK